MDVIIGVRAHLASLPALAALVPIERMYSPILQAKTFGPTDSSGPAIQIQVLPDEEEAHLRGPCQLFKDHIQVDAWARTMDQARLIAVLCRRRLDGFKGIWVGAGSPAPSLAVRSILWTEGRELFEDEVHGGVFRRLGIYRVTYTNSEEQMLISA